MSYPGPQYHLGSMTKGYLVQLDQENSYFTPHHEQTLLWFLMATDERLH